MPCVRASILLSFAILYFIWGSTFLAIRISVFSIPPLLVGGFRHFFGGVLLLLAILPFTKIRLEWRAVGNALFVGMLTAGISNGSLIVVEKTVPSSVAAIAFTAMPLMMLVMNWISFEKLKPTRFDLIAVSMGILGTSLVLGAGKSFKGSSLSVFEIVLLVGCPLMWSFGSLVGRRLKLPSSILFSSAVQMIGGGSLLFLVATLNRDWPRLVEGPIEMTSVWSVIYLTIVGSLIGYSAFAYVIKNVDPRIVGTYAFVNPVVALLLGIVWGEKVLSREVIFGASLAILSVATVIVSRLRFAKFSR